MMITLDIFSDPVCPWCYIGKANLDRALERSADHPFRVEWHPFLLNPDLPPVGMDRRAFMQARFGDRMAVVRLHVPVLEAAEAAGVEINFERIGRMPSTLNAHRLIHWAGLEGRQTAVKGALMRAYFRDGRDIGDVPTLVAIAAETGLDGALIARLFAGDADTETIRSRDAHARARGVRAVPTFILGNTHALQGAQPAAVWERVMSDLRSQTSAGAG